MCLILYENSIVDRPIAGNSLEYDIIREVVNNKNSYCLLVERNNK